MDIKTKRKELKRLYEMNQYIKTVFSEYIIYKGTIYGEVVKNKIDTGLFYLLDNEKQKLQQGIHTYSLSKGVELEYVIGEIRNNLEEIGIDLEATHSEYGPAQIEIIIDITMKISTVVLQNNSQIAEPLI